MAWVQGHGIIQLGSISRGQVGLLWSRKGCIEGHSEVYRDRFERKGIGSSVSRFITLFTTGVLFY